MEPLSALQALLLSAQLAGVDGQSAQPPPALPAQVAGLAAQPKPVLSIPLQDISAAQERAVSWAKVGRGDIGFSLGLDPEASLWLKLRQGNRSAAHPLASLEQGVEERFPVETYRFVLENGLIRAFPASQPQSRADIPVRALLRSVFASAQRVVFAPVSYAALHEDGGLVPASVSLIREDQEGTLWVTHGKAADLERRIQWFLAVNGVMFGMKLDAGRLVFYSQPAAPGAAWRCPEKPLGGGQSQNFMP